MFRVEIRVVDDLVPAVGGDDPRTVKTFEVGCSYNKRDIAERFALRVAELANLNEPRITGKGQARQSTDAVGQHGVGKVTISTQIPIK
jgi:hypothetical protein